MMAIYRNGKMGEEGPKNPMFLAREVDSCELCAVSSAKMLIVFM